ncbi:MAG: helix-turn-helix domain-containing protein [Acidobacteria bacterium]|nr:helix-turn-helix domain-containing protein [Acidobacteriota bacterium]
MSSARGTQTEPVPSGRAAPAAAGLRPEARLLTVPEVADFLRINKSTVYRMAKQGRLPATRVGRQWRFRKSVLDSLLDPN